METIGSAQQELSAPCTQSRRGPQQGMPQLVMWGLGSGRRLSEKLQMPYPEPQTPNPKLQALHPKPQPLHPKPCSTTEAPPE